MIQSDVLIEHVESSLTTVRSACSCSILVKEWSLSNYISVSTVNDIISTINNVATINNNI